MLSNTLTDPANYDRFYLEYLKNVPDQVYTTGEMQDLVGPVNAYSTIQSDLPLKYHLECLGYPIIKLSTYIYIC